MLQIQMERTEAKRKLKLTCPACQKTYELSLAYTPKVCHMCSCILPNVVGIINDTGTRIDHYKEI